MSPKRMLFVDDLEEEEDFIEVSEGRTDVEEEDEELVEVDLDDEIEEIEVIEEEEDKDLEEKEDDDLEGEEEEEDKDLQEKEDDLEEEKEEIEEEDKDLEEREDDDLEEEEDEGLQEVEDKDLQEKEDLEEGEGSFNSYYIGKKSPTHSNDEIKNHDGYPLYSNNNQTTTSEPKMPTAKPTILSKRAAENRKYVEVTRSKIRKVLDGSKREDRFGKKESGKKFGGTCCRLWSEDDEITLLKGMIDYHAEKGVDPYADMGAFHKFIVTLLHVDVSKDQLVRKIRRLKNKYQNNKMEDGKDPVFTKLHEQKSFKLSKKIWGVEDDNDVDDDEVLHEKFWSLYPCLSESLHLEQFSKYSLPDCGMSFVKERLSSIGSTKAKEFEDKWRQLHVAETRVNMKRAQLILEQTKLILNAIK